MQKDEASMMYSGNDSLPVALLKNQMYLTGALRNMPKALMPWWNLIRSKWTSLTLNMTCGIINIKKGSVCLYRTFLNHGKWNYLPPCIAFSSSIVISL